MVADDTPAVYLARTYVRARASQHTASVVFVGEQALYIDMLREVARGNF